MLKHPTSKNVTCNQNTGCQTLSLSWLQSGVGDIHTAISVSRRTLATTNYYYYYYPHRAVMMIFIFELCNHLSTPLSGKKVYQTSCFPLFLRSFKLLLKNPGFHHSIYCEHYNLQWCLYHPLVFHLIYYYYLASTSFSSTQNESH